MKWKTVFFIFFLGIQLVSYSQNFIHGNQNIWFLNINRIQFNEKWSFTNEIHERTGNWFREQGQFLLRPSLDYHMNKNLEFSLGYSFIHVWPYAPYLFPLEKSENNIWQQFLFKMDAGKWKVQNRLRQENRWLDHFILENGEYLKSGFDYANRFRYRFIATRDFPMKQNEKKYFINFWDEIWLNQDKHLRPIDFTRNWFYLGIGFRFSDKMNIQLGYLNQIDKINSTSFIQSDVIQITLQKNWTLGK